MGSPLSWRKAPGGRGKKPLRLGAQGGSRSRKGGCRPPAMGTTKGVKGGKRPTHRNMHCAMKGEGKEAAEREAGIHRL